ncbi:hypothetical protein Agub_g13286, partial [Astrephomene gubernaculifera]
VEMSSGQLLKQLKLMGLKFRQLTEGQVTQLRSLHTRYRSDPDALLMIAAQLPGGWTSKDVKRLMRKHGLTGATRRGRGAHDDSDDGSGSGSDEGDEEEEGEEGEEAPAADPAEVAALDEEELGVLWEQFGGQAEAVEQIAAGLVSPSSAAAVAARLRLLGLLPPLEKKKKKEKAKKDSTNKGKDRKEAGKKG